MKTTLLLSLTALALATGFSAPSASAADTCKKDCSVMKKKCKEQKKQSCGGDLLCRINEFEDCRDIYDDCIERCEASAASK